MERQEAIPGSRRHEEIIEGPLAITGWESNPQPCRAPNTTLSIPSLKIVNYKYLVQAQKRTSSAKEITRRAVIGELGCLSLTDVDSPAEALH